MLRYLIGIVIFTFKVETGNRGGCEGSGGWHPSKFGRDWGGCGGRGFCSGGFSVIFVLYSNDIPCEVLPPPPSISSL